MQAGQPEKDSTINFPLCFFESEQETQNSSKNAPILLLSFSFKFFATEPCECSTGNQSKHKIRFILPEGTASDMICSLPLPVVRVKTFLSWMGLSISIKNLSNERSYSSTFFIYLINSCVFYVTVFPPKAWLHFSAFKPHASHNSSIRSDEGLMFKTLALATLFSGQFSSSSHLIKSNYLTISV